MTATLRDLRTKLVGLSRDEQRLLGYLGALVGVAFVSLAIAIVRTRAQIPNLIILHLFVVLALASTVGRRPAIVASVLAILSYNFFFTEPVYTFTISDPYEWLALLVFLLTALVTGQQAGALHERAAEARRRELENAALYSSLNQALEARAAEAQLREHITSTLYELSRALVAKQEPGELLGAIAEQVVTVLGVRSCAILLPDERGRLAIEAGHATDGEPITLRDRGDEVTAQWAFSQPAAHPPGPARYHQILYVPLQTSGNPIGLLRVEAAESRALLSETDSQLLATFAAQAALAIERTRLAREAVRAEILARSDELKDALLSSVSHDLRTPLVAIRAAAGNLLQEDIAWDAETRREFATAIDEEAARLNHLVGNLLDVSRIDAGSLRARKALYPLDALIRAAVERLASRTANQPIDVDLPADLPPVLLDAVQVDQALTNLLENALKYAPEGTPITVTVAVTPAVDAVLVEVADRGPGVPPAERQRIFDKFYRLRRDTHTPGSGLGLAIARGLIAAHGGRIWATDRPDGGARFIFSLPLPSGEPTRGRASDPQRSWETAARLEDVEDTVAARTSRQGVAVQVREEPRDG